MRNIIVCAEHGFVMQLVVNLVAFYESNRENDFHIYILPGQNWMKRMILCYP